MLSFNIHSNKIKGFTLVELMVSIVISSVIMLGVVSLYSTSRKGQKTNESLARIQENLRFAADMITKDIRMAGYTGCKSSSVTNALADTTSSQYKFDEHIQGFEAGTAFPAQFPAVGTTAGLRVANTDGVAILRSSAKGCKISIHNANSAKITMDVAACDLETDDILLISDCNHSAVFQVSQAQTDHIVHNTGSGSPGNCWKKMGPVPNPVPACGGGGGTLYNYDDDARVHKYIMHGYFIGISTSGATNSLYVVNLDKGVTTATELVEGIEDLQISYGVDTNGDGVPERFIKANDTGMDFKEVVAVKFGMLLASTGDVKAVASPAAKNYTLADTTVSAGPDQKLRFVYNTTVKIRNKGVR